MKMGKVYLVGAGPGAEDLITCRGKELLRSCQAVVYDHLACDGLLRLVPPDAEQIYVGKQAGRHAMKQEQINELLISLAGQGRMVVRLKGGDPFVFGRGGEEILALKQKRIPWELVPGVTSAVAVPELAGIPVTHRSVSRSFHVITAHTADSMEEQARIRECAALKGTLVFLMGLGRLSMIMEQLRLGGMNPQTPAAVIENGSTPLQRVVRGTVADIEETADRAGIRTPAVIVVGETAAFDFLCGYDRSLRGMVVGMTGTRSFTDRLRAALEGQGAQTRLLCTLEMETDDGTAHMRSLVNKLDAFTWLVLTSVNGVELFFENLWKMNLDVRALGGMRIAVIGEATGRALGRWGLRADLMPEPYCAETLAEVLKQYLTSDDRVLLARSADGSAALNRMLEETGTDYLDLPLYRVVPSACSEVEKAAECTHLVFASASGVRAFLEAAELKGCELPGKGVKTVAIGPVTAAELKARWRKADLEGASYQIPGIIDALKGDGGTQDAP